MAWVTMETIFGNGKRYCLDLESDGLHKINPNWSGRILDFPDKITKLCVTEDMLVIQTEDRDFRDGRQSASWIKDNRQINNVDAYDHNGNHLWNIGSIIGDIKMQIDGIHYISADQVKNEYGVDVQCDQKNLFCCTAGGFVMIIDAIQQKMLLKKSGAVN